MSVGDRITGEIIASSIPQAVLEPHGRNSLAIGDGAINEKNLLVDLTTLSPDDEHPAPTEEELTTLRKVTDSIPTIIWLFCIVEFSERASYYGAQTIFSNFLEYPLPAGGPGTGATPKGSQETAGALNEGEQFSNAFVLLFQFLAYVVPILGAWIADTRLGRMKTIGIGVIICFVAHIILIISGVPSILQAGHAVAPFILGLLILAFGAGIFKPNVAPLLLDQYRYQKPYTKVLKSGEKVIVDPESTIQRLMLIFYALINIGAFYALACAYAEKDVGYWLAFTLPTIVFMLLPFLLVFMYPRTYKVQPSGSALSTAFKIVRIALTKSRGKFWKKDFWDAAKPSKLAEQGITSYGGKPIDWNDKAVKDVARTIQACAIFLYFPIYSANDGGVGNVATNQGSTMTTNGAPNDLLNNFNPLVIIIAIPLMSHGLYPLLRKYNIKFGRISRITFGFHLAWISGVIGAVVQYRVYKTNPCGYYATTCANNGTGVSPISIWWQIPNVGLGALSECFAIVTSYEMAYARSPKSMKALVFSICLFMQALSAALGEVLTPVIVDPYLIWVWAGLAIACFVQTVIFWFRYKHLDNDEFMTYEEEEAEEERRLSVMEERIPIEKAPIPEEDENPGASKEVA